MPDHAATPSTGSRTEFTRSLHRSSGSFELVFAPVILALVGLWLDRTLDTLPAFTVGLAVFGAIGAGVAQYYAYQQRMLRLAEDGELHLVRPDGQYHARNRSDGDLGAAHAAGDASGDSASTDTPATLESGL